MEPSRLSSAQKNAPSTASCTQENSGLRTPNLGSRVLEVSSPTPRSRANLTIKRRLTVSARSPNGGRMFSLRSQRIMIILAAIAMLFSLRVAVGYFFLDELVQGSYWKTFLDGGPGELWMPPDERPVPYRAFPSPRDSLLVNVTGSGGGIVEQMEEDEDEGEKAKTLVFLHLWKCAGSSLRNLLRDWAGVTGQKMAIVVRCAEVDAQVTQRATVTGRGESGRICLKAHQLIDARRQGPYVRQHQVLAGHFTYGFQKHVMQPYVMFTTLRNPLEAFVSGQQYLNRKLCKVLYKAVGIVENMIKVTLEREDVGASSGGRPVKMTRDKFVKTLGYVYRLVDPEVVPKLSAEEAAEEAKSNLDTVWLVGVTEQYNGFMKVLRKMMDPNRRHGDVWKEYAVTQYNVSPQPARKILGALDEDLLARYNHTLRFQWTVYEHAIELFKFRCREILDEDDHDTLCQVPRAPAEYTLSEVEQEELYQGENPEMHRLTPEEVVRAKEVLRRHWDVIFTGRAPPSEGGRAPGSPGQNRPAGILRVDVVFGILKREGFNLQNAEKRQYLLNRLSAGI